MRVRVRVQPVGVQLVSVQTSPNDRLLWVLDNRGGVYVRTGLSHQMPVGTDWEPVPGSATGEGSAGSGVRGQPDPHLRLLQVWPSATWC